MTNDEFRDLTAFLNMRCKALSGVPLASLHYGGWVSMSRKLRSDLEIWEREVAARAKAEFANAADTAEHVRNDFGPDAWDAIEVNHMHGLKFGDDIIK